MASKMNNDTHKVIVAEYTVYQYWAVPIDWELDECHVKYNNLYYKDHCLDGVRDEDVDHKYPDSDLREEELEDYSMFFDCEEDDDE